MRHHKGASRVLAGLGGSVLLLGLTALAPAAGAPAASPAALAGGNADPIASNSSQMLDEGRATFRYDTFGDQAARRLGQPRPERRRDRQPRPQRPAGRPPISCSS